MRLPCLCALLTTLPSLAAAVDFDWSGFATVGYAISDKPYRYQRVIDEHGTFARDSVLGIQLDARVSSAVGATRAWTVTAIHPGIPRWPGPSSPGGHSTSCCCAPASCAFR
ncbi:MAG: hypothetical protein F9K30_06830 [Dechloromonas sp.]|nr:MAG: hypothetical protein F9K30_06830 [Dechloromonas sp.]